MLFIVRRATCGLVIYKLDFKSVMDVSKCGVSLPDLQGWSFRCFSRMFGTAVVANKVFSVVRSFFGTLIYETTESFRVKSVSDNGIKFFDAHDWGSSRYDEIRFLIEDWYGTFFISRATCGMYIYKLIGNDVFSINQCKTELSDENGFGMRKCYWAIGVAVFKNELCVYSRGVFETWVNKPASGTTNLTKLSICQISFSHKIGWDGEKYYLSIKDSAEEHELLIYAHSSFGLSIYKQVGTNIHIVLH